MILLISKRRQINYHIFNNFSFESSEPKPSVQLKDIYNKSWHTLIETIF